MEYFQHIITEKELSEHPELFHNGALPGEQIQLSGQQYEALGLELHQLTREDIENDRRFSQFGLTAGDVIERPIPIIEINPEETPVQ